MEVFGDYVFLGGGGGYEISNLIQVFKYPAKMVDVPVLDKPVFEYKSDKKVANFMRMAKEVSPYPVSKKYDRVQHRYWQCQWVKWSHFSKLTPKAER